MVDAGGIAVSARPPRSDSGRRDPDRAAQRLDRGGRARASSDGSCCCPPMVEAVRVVAEHRRPRSRSSSSSTGSILRPGSVFSTSADALTLRRPDRRPPRAPSASNTRVVTGSGRRTRSRDTPGPPQTRARPYPEAQGLPARLQRVRDEGAGQSSGRHPRPRRHRVQRRASSSSFNLTPMLFVGVMTAITLGVHRQGCADRRLRHDSRTAATLARFSHV